MILTFNRENGCCMLHHCDGPDVTLFIDHEAGKIICLVAAVCLFVCLQKSAVENIQIVLHPLQSYSPVNNFFKQV